MTALTAATGCLPRYLTRSGPESAMGGLAATADLLGRPLRSWQTTVPVLDRVEGRWRFPLNVLSLPRQSGKTSFVTVAAIDRCLRVDGAQVWYTAQTRSDAAARLVEMAQLLAGSSLRSWSARYPPREQDAGEWDYRVTLGWGNETVSFPNGSSLRIFAPREDSLHGSVTDLVIIDEARFFSSATGAALLAAALPTQVTRDGQIWVTSTAGGPESTWLAELMDHGRASVDDPDSKVCYGEWGIADTVGEGDLLEAVWAAHPAAGLPGGPGRTAVEFAAETMPAWQFAHEYGNRWRSAEASRLIPAEWWESTFTSATPDGRVCFSVEVSPDRSSAAVLVCADRVVDVVKSQSGVGWLADEVRRLVEVWDPRAVVVDPGGPAVTVADELRVELDGRLVEMKTRDVTAACGQFFDGLAARTVTHRANPALDNVVADVSKRQAGGAWVFSRANGGHLLLAAALAVWADSRPVESEGWFIS